MEIFYLVAKIYLAIGFVYASYVFVNGTDKCYAFPINMLLGPPFIIYLFYKALRRQRITLD